MIDHETRRKQIRLEGRLALPESEQSRGAPPSFAVYWKGGERSQRPSAAAPASDVVADRRAVDFWRSVGFRGEVATAEALLRSAFPRELERRLETAFATKGVPRPIEPVSLEVLAVRYGSLEFLVGGAGVAAFASMVQSVGPAVALMLIEACVQDSLEATFDVSARDATVQLRSGSFGAPPSTAGPGTGAAQGTWGQVLSAAPKVFWLLPTLLALIVLSVLWRSTISARAGCS